jgi:hypothetical protein
LRIVVSFTVRERTTLFNLGQLPRLAVASIRKPRSSSHGPSFDLYVRIP